MQDGRPVPARRRGRLNPPEKAQGHPGGAPPGLDHFRAFAGLLKHGVAVLDASGTVVFANERACRILRRPPGDLEGRPLGEGCEIVSSDGEALTLEAAGLAAGAAGQPRPSRILGLSWGDGPVAWVDSSVRPLETAEGAFLVWSLSDMTRWKQGRDALEASERQLAAVLEELPVGVVLYGEDGRVVVSNRASRPYVGEGLGEQEGPQAQLTRLGSIHEDGRPMALWEHPAVRAFQSGQPVTNVVLGIEHPRTGQLRWVLVNAHPQMGPEGRPVSVLTTVVDITRRRHVEEQVARQLGQLRAIYALSTAAGRATTIEEACTAAFEALADTMKPDAAVALLKGVPGRKQVACAETTKEHQAALRLAARWLHRQGLGGPAFLSCDDAPPAARAGLRSAGFTTIAVAPLATGDGHLGTLVAAWGAQPEPLPEATELLGTIAVHLAIAMEQRRASEQLLASEAKYRTLFEDALEGIYRTTPEGNILTANPALVEMLGFDSEAELLGRSVPSLFWHPSDRAAALERLEAAGKLRNHELTLRRKDGGLITVVENARVVRDGRGRVLHYEGTLEDVSERKQAEDLFETVASSSPAGVFILQDGRFQFLNPRFTEILGYGEQDLLGGAAMDLVLPEDRGAVREAAIAMLRGERSEAYEYRTITRSGKVRWVMESLQSVTYRGRRAALGTFLDITQRKEMERDLQRQAHFDSLTGLPNRQYFMEQLESQFAAAAPGEQVALLFLDLDGFKAVNDRHGHAAGDEALAAVAGRLRNCLRDPDLAARMGGDEFTVLLRGPAVRHEAERIARRILRAFEAPIQTARGTARLSASIGIAFGEPGKSHAGEILRQADVALYHAKAAGKSRYRVFRDERAA